VVEKLKTAERQASASLDAAKALREHMRTLPYTLAPLRAFEEQLRTLTKALETREPLGEDVAVSGAILNRPNK